VQSTPPGGLKEREIAYGEVDFLGLRGGICVEEAFRRPDSVRGDTNAGFEAHKALRGAWAETGPSAYCDSSPPTLDLWLCPTRPTQGTYWGTCCLPPIDRLGLGR